MIRTGGVRVPDVIGKYRWAVHDRTARLLADRVELGDWADALVWADLVGEDARLRAFRAAVGNRPASVADWSWTDEQGRLW